MPLWINLNKNIEDIKYYLEHYRRKYANDKIFQKGNLKSRLRTMFMRGKSGFVVGRDNFTEKLLVF